MLAADLPLPRLRYPDRASEARFAKEVLRELRSNPRVEAAGFVSRLPLSPSNTVGDLVVPGREKEAFSAELRLASDGYFEALRFSLKEGRTFTAPQRGAQAVGRNRESSADGGACSWFATLYGWSPAFSLPTTRTVDRSILAGYASSSSGSARMAA